MTVEITAEVSDLVGWGRRVWINSQNSAAHDRAVDVSRWMVLSTLCDDGDLGEVIPSKAA